MSVYDNVVLQRGSRNFRVFHLSPGETSETPLSGRLQVVSLDRTPEYYALSYTWGEAKFDYSIRCNGYDLAITSNLRLALLRLRNTGKTVFWIDQICIDQRSVAERSDQVRFMADIYQRASNVYVWLGQQTESTALGIQLATHLAFASDTDILEAKITQPVVNDTEIYTDKIWAGYYELFESPWFSRCWVIQEVISQRHPVALCGDYEFPWEILPYSAARLISSLSLMVHNALKARRTAAYLSGRTRCLEMAFGMGKSAKEHYPFIDQFRSTALGKFVDFRINLIDLFKFGAEFLATDLRDKVYSLLGFMEDAKISIMPDYTLPVEIVYQRFAEALIGAGLGPLLITAAGSSRSQMNGLPSWVLDLSLDPTPLSPTLDQFARSQGRSLKAGGEFQGVVTLGPGPSQITVKGIVLDIVQDISPCRLESEVGVTGPPAQLFLRWRDKVLQLLEDSWCAKSRYRTARERHEALHKLFAGEDSRFKNRSTEYFTAYTAQQSELLEHMRPPPGREAGIVPKAVSEIARISDDGFLREYSDHFNLFTFGRKLCVTTQGYFGVVVHSTEPGDRVCIIPGCSVPVILRRVADGAVYTLVGDAFILEIMNGEAFKSSGLSLQEIIIN